MSNRSTAGLYLAHGWSVLPISPGSKAAARPWKELQTQRPTEVELDQWFSKPSINIGIVTGRVSNLVVVDLDEASAIDALVQEIGVLPVTRQVVTERGLHLYFRYPSEHSIPSRAGVRPHLDVRGDGGYVVAPPSVNANGHQYAWVDESVPIGDLPAPLLSMLSAPSPDTTAIPDSEGAVIPEGTRNARLTSLAGRMLAEGHRVKTVRKHLHTVNQTRCQPPLDPGEVDRIVDSIHTREERKPKRKLSVQRLDQIQEEQVDWMWRGVLAKGITVIFDGAPGVGKSLLVYDLISRYTTGRAWPDGSPPGEVRPVLIVQPEDHIPSVVGPRLRVAGAAPDLVHIAGIEGETVQLPRDFELLREAILHFRPGLVVLDPLTMLFEHGRDDNRRGDSVAVLAPVKQLAQEIGFCLIVVRHTKKDTTGGAMGAGAGSFAANGIARAVFLIGTHPREQSLHLMAPTKISLDQKRKALRFRIVDDNGVGRVEWDGTDDCSADDIATMNKRIPKKDEALEFVARLLQERGPLPLSEVKREAVTQGHAERTVERAMGTAAFAERIERVEAGSAVMLRVRELAA